MLFAVFVLARYVELITMLVDHRWVWESAYLYLCPSAWTLTLTYINIVLIVLSIFIFSGECFYILQI